MDYKALKNNKIESDGYAIVPFREKDMHLIMKWRNEQMDVLRQKKALTIVDQENYYRNVIEPSFNDSDAKLILFSLIKDDKCIGYGGLTNIDWESKRAEVSFLAETDRIDDERIYGSDFSAFLNLLKVVTFKDLRFHRLFTETYDIRPFHISILEKAGFVREGRMKGHSLINGKYVDSVIHGLINE